MVAGDPGAQIDGSPSLGIGFEGGLVELNLTGLDASVIERCGEKDSHSDVGLRDIAYHSVGVARGIVSFQKVFGEGTEQTVVAAALG